MRIDNIFIPSHQVNSFVNRHVVLNVKNIQLFYYQYF
jgi:hypothetical protein